MANGLKTASRREYLRNYGRKWIAERRQQWIKANGPCTRCGSWLDPQVDHIDATTKKIQTASLWSMSPSNPRRIAELAKCQVLCKNCHLEKSRHELAIYAALQPHTNKSGVRGVTIENGRYRVRTWQLGKQISLGMFDTLEEADQALINYRNNWTSEPNPMLEVFLQEMAERNKSLQHE